MQSEEQKNWMDLVDHWLFLTMQDLLQKYNREPLDCNTQKNVVAVDQKIPIWICWWQGIDQAPELVKKCIASVERYAPQDCTEIRLITFENYMEYVTFSDVIAQRFNDGKITLTHLSDILRAKLLYQYGGLWLDATYFISDARFEKIFEKNFYTIKAGGMTWSGDYLVRGRWSGNFMLLPKGHALAGFLVDAFERYWSVRDTLMDYFLIDFLIKLAYEYIPDVHRQIEECPVGNTQFLRLMESINMAYDEEIWQELQSDTLAHKLSYKEKLNLWDEQGRETFYSKVL